VRVEPPPNRDLFHSPKDRALPFYHLECSSQLVALLGGAVALQVPRALLFQQVFEATRGLLRVVFRRALDSRDCVVWLALAVRTRVVVVVAPP
jgi:hypothetical protein